MSFHYCNCSVKATKSNYKEMRVKYFHTFCEKYKNNIKWRNKCSNYVPQKWLLSAFRVWQEINNPHKAVVFMIKPLLFKWKTREVKVLGQIWKLKWEWQQSHIEFVLFSISNIQKMNMSKSNYNRSWKPNSGISLHCLLSSHLVLFHMIKRRKARVPDC